MAYERKKKQSRPVKLLLVLAVLIPLALTIIATTIGRKEFTLPHRLALEFLGVAQSVVSTTTGFFSDVWHHYFFLVGVTKENERLRREIKEFKALNAGYREAVATNVRLNKLLGLEQSFQGPVLTAGIVGRDPALWFKSLTINKGSSAGIEKGMPAVTLEGVVGQVVNVSPHFAKILLATDPNSAIDAIVQATRAQGIIKGDGRAYRLHYLLKSNRIEEGDHIVTSGMGGVFPKGVPIGRVSEVFTSRRGMFHKVRVEPAVNFRELEYVTILLRRDSLAD